MSTSHGGWLGHLAIVGLVLIVPGTQTPAYGSLRGVVTDAEGIALPGVALSVTGDHGEYTTYAGIDGAYRIELPAGQYELVARLRGFCTQRRVALHVRGGSSVYQAFSMTYAVVPEILHTLRSPQAAFRSADAVVRLRVTRSHEPQPWSGDRHCGLAGIQHEASVLNVFKGHVALDLTDSMMRFVQYPVGRWNSGVFESSRTSRARYEVGDEFIALLQWNELFQRFTPLRPSYMIPVRNGRIRGPWPGGAVDIRDGMRIDDFVRALRGREAG